MPFGLRNPSAVFQRVMDSVLRGVEYAACYIDDVVIFSTTKQQHLQDVERTLAAIEAAGLTCHPKKCRWGEQTVQYLGYEVKWGQIGIQQAKVEVLDRLREPKDRSGLRAVLGFLSYYRRFVLNFSKRAAVLNGLLREDKAWEWGEAQKGAPEDLMTAVKTATVLKLPAADHPFTLYPDWSSQWMGGILCREVKGEKKVVAYASRSCNSAEAQYSSYIGKGLAAVWAVGHFRVYLQGREFTLVTDHKPLTWLMTTLGLTGRNPRWAMKLQEYDFKIKHRPGKTLQHVDGLSRNPPLQEPTMTLTLLARLNGAKGQKGPADIWEDRPAMRWVKGETGEDEELTARVRARGQHYRWYQQQLQVQTEDGWKLVPAPSEREAVIKEHVSKWLEVRAIPSKSSRHVAAPFKEQVICRFGACAEVLTDQGTEFQGEFKKLLEETGITHRRTSRYHPHSDGLTERLVQTLKRGLQAYTVTAGTIENWVALSEARARYLRVMMPAALENLHTAQLRDARRCKERQQQGAGGRAKKGVSQGQEVYLKRAKQDTLDVAVGSERWRVKEVRPSGYWCWKMRRGQF
ncbi:unnamed protein product [Closterium sp. NIES-64]|nr:unnamed protein product [Closterium sp. NIES-64]